MRRAAHYLGPADMPCYWQGSEKSISEKPVFQKAHPTGFLVLLGFGLYWVFRFFYLNEQLGSLLVDLAHTSDYLKKLQYRYLLVARSCKHNEIFNYYWHEKLKLN